MDYIRTERYSIAYGPNAVYRITRHVDGFTHYPRGDAISEIYGVFFTAFQQVPTRIDEWIGQELADELKPDWYYVPEIHLPYVTPATLELYLDQIKTAGMQLEAKDVWTDRDREWRAEIRAKERAIRQQLKARPVVPSNKPEQCTDAGS